eukprot:339983_1
MMSRVRCCSCLLIICFAIVQFESMIVSGAQLSEKESQDNYGVNNPTSGSLMIDRCLNCNADASKTCIGCKLARYCSKKCQKIHWNGVHRSICPGKNEYNKAEIKENDAVEYDQAYKDEVKASDVPKPKTTKRESQIKTYHWISTKTENSEKSCDNKVHDPRLFSFKITTSSTFRPGSETSRILGQLRPDQLVRLEEVLNKETKIIIDGTSFNVVQAQVTQEESHYEDGFEINGIHGPLIHNFVTMIFGLVPQDTKRDNVLLPLVLEADVVLSEQMPIDIYERLLMLASLPQIKPTAKKW